MVNIELVLTACLKTTVGFEKALGAVYLEVRAGDAGGDLFEERLLDADELRRLDHVQDLLDLSEEHHLETQHGTHSAFITINRRRIIQQKRRRI